MSPDVARLPEPPGTKSRAHTRPRKPVEINSRVVRATGRPSSNAGSTPSKSPAKASPSKSPAKPCPSKSPTRHADGAAAVSANKTRTLQTPKSIRGRSRTKNDGQPSPFAHVETLREPSGAPARVREMWEVPLPDSVHYWPYMTCLGLQRGRMFCFRVGSQAPNVRRPRFGCRATCKSPSRPPATAFTHALHAVRASTRPLARPVLQCCHPPTD